MVSIFDLFFTSRDNISDKWEQYLAIYDAELKSWAGRDVDVLEVGVQNGGSMSVWSGYFGSGSKIVGLDIDERVALLSHPENVRLAIADATDAARLDEVLGDETFDLIIDDGSHMSADVLRSFALLYPRLRPGGKYVIEDLHCSYWPEYGGGVGSANSSVEYLKRFVDVLHADHIPALADLDLDISDGHYHLLRQTIGRIAFYDSVAVVDKLPFVKQQPYRRLLAGGSGSVADPLDLIAAFESVDHIRFAEPLARQIETDVVGLFRQVRAAQTETRARIGDLETRLAASEFEAAQLREELTTVQAQLTNVERDRDRLDSERQMSARALTASITLSRQADDLSATTTRENASLRERIAELDAEVARRASNEHGLGEAVVSLRNEVDAIRRSKTYRMADPLRLGARAARSVMARRRNGPSQVAPPPTDVSSSSVRSTRMSDVTTAGPGDDGLDEFDLRLIEDHIRTGGLPRLDVLIVAEGHSISAATAVAAAMRADQVYSDWDAVVIGGAVDTATSPAATADSGVRVASIDDVIDGLNGPCVIVEASAMLRPEALYLLACELHEGVTLTYGDHERIEADGTITRTFKPGPSPEHQQRTRYVGTTVAVDASDPARRAIIERGLRSGDLEHLVTELLNESWRTASRVPFVIERRRRPVARYAGPSGFDPSLADGVTVSIIIPTRDRLSLLEPCIDSLLADTAFPRDRFQIIVVDNGSEEPATLRYLERIERTRTAVVVRDEGDFNYPRLNNRAAAVATGDVLVLLNNDTTVHDRMWLDRLVETVMQPGIGVVGAKLLYPDGSVQHGGVALGIQGVAAHVNHRLNPGDHGYQAIGDQTHEISAVTGACLAIRADVFRELGGLDETLAVTFNDVDLCCATIAAGYRNVYIGDPLIVHHESKSRGYDLTEAQHEFFRSEAVRARAKHRSLYSDDPAYHPGLSLDRTYEVATASRATRPWVTARRRVHGSRTIVMLSHTHQRGHGVAVVLDLQARHLASAGHRVVLAGPMSDHDYEYPGCERVELHTPEQAAIVARERRADVVMIHTPPYYSTTRWLGPEQITVAYDYGEPPADLFPDAAARRGVAGEKRFAMSLADYRYAISDAVRDESGFADMGVIPLGNEHLTAWSDEVAARRERVRDNLGWSDRVVILNVCRFHAGERRYKGVDAYSALFEVARGMVPDLRDRIVFAMAGKADQSDVALLRSMGLRVFANVSDDYLVDLYAAADGYINLSRWEGYNLGIGQALAFGLPTLASDIPAHRAFGIRVTDDPVYQIDFLRQVARSVDTPRTPRIWSWREPLAQLDRLVEEWCSTERRPR